MYPIIGLLPNNSALLQIFRSSSWSHNRVVYVQSMIVAWSILTGVLCETESSSSLVSVLPCVPPRVDKLFLNDGTSLFCLTDL